MRVYPGTALYQTARRKNVVTEKADLLDPTFYLSPDVSQERIAQLLAGFKAESQNWIVGSPDPAMMQIMEQVESIERPKGLCGNSLVR